VYYWEAAAAILEYKKIYAKKKEVEEVKQEWEGMS